MTISAALSGKSRNILAEGRLRSGALEHPMILECVLELYASSNGDKWEITRDDDGRLFIRHVPNAESGGRASILDFQAFLAADHKGPEHMALEALLREGELVVAPEHKKQVYLA